MPKFDLPANAYIDVRFSVSEAYDKVSERGNVTVAPETVFAEVIGHSDGLAKVSMTFGRYGTERGKIAFFVQPKGLASPKPAAKPKAAAKPAAKPKGKAPAKAPAPAEATDLQQMIATEIAKALAAMAAK